MIRQGAAGWGAGVWGQRPHGRCWPTSRPGLAWGRRTSVASREVSALRMGLLLAFSDVYRCSSFDLLEAVRNSIPLAPNSDAGELVHGGVLGLGGPGGKGEKARERRTTETLPRAPSGAKRAAHSCRSVRRGVAGPEKEGVKPFPTDRALEDRKPDYRGRPVALAWRHGCQTPLPLVSDRRESPRLQGRALSLRRAAGFRVGGHRGKG